MSQLFIRVTKGTGPIDLAIAKNFLRVDSTADDDLITSMIDAAVDFASDYTSRQYRTDTQWRLMLDEFDDRLCIRRSPVKAITKIERLVSNVWTTVSSSVYYLKQDVTFPEILLKSGQTWPTDVDEIEHGIRIDFTTEPHVASLDQVKQGILRLLSAMYEDRGDNEAMTAGSGVGAVMFPAINDLARKSGATQFFMSHRVPRI